MRIKTLIRTLVFVFALQGIAPMIAWAAPDQMPATEQTKDIKYKSKEQTNNKYAGYEVDAFSSASKLAAQRSHTPAGEDERNFAVFTGIVVILIVVFLSQILFKRN